MAKWQLTSQPTPVPHIQQERFTTEQHGYRLENLSLTLSGNIAVSGRHIKSKRTFIELYFGSNSVSRDKLKLFYSQEFEKYSNYLYRHVSFLEKRNGSELLVTCIGDKIAIIDTKNKSKVLRSCRVNGETRCLAVRKGEIFIGLLQSHTVIVFNNNLKETKKIKLKGIKDVDFPCDLQVIKDKVFVRTWNGRALSIAESDGSITTQYTDTGISGTYTHALSITVSERLGLVAVLWSRDRIIVYSLNESKSFFVFDVDTDGVRIIRISDRDKMIITGNQETGEIKIYDLPRALYHELDQVKQKYEDQEQALREKIKTTEQKLKEEATISTEKIETLTEELEQTKQLIVLCKIQSAKQIETLTDELKETRQSFDISRTESARQIATLTDELAQTRLKSTAETEALQRELEWTKQVLNKTTEDRVHTKAELKQYQLDFAKESKSLREVLNQTKDAMADLQKRTVDDKSSTDSEETRFEDVSILVAEFGRLNVVIAEYLTLDHCLKLATLFNVPPSACDMLRRVSFIESPGIKLLDLLNTRNVINMYDVTNLQKGLAMVHLEAVNIDLLLPYQESVDANQYKLHKAEEMFTWEEVHAFVNTIKEDTARHQLRDNRTSPNNDTEPDNTSQQEGSVQLSDRAVENRGSGCRVRPHQMYIEQIIGKEGGKIHLANVALTIPPYALQESHVIAFTVMNEFPFARDREVDTARMTPIIKLEPLGLTFKKSVKLNIPHSALIPAPENHDVIIYSGNISKNKVDSSECIQWTVEKSLPRQLKEKSVSIDAECLSYLSASLVSQTTVPSSFSVRVVSLVDGVRKASDDITLTICFCSDNDSEYNMLLSDYKTKLPLEEYSTLHLRRHSERNEDDAGFLSVTVTSVNNTYVPDAEQAVKSFAVSHLCTASRVSQQIRFTRNEDTDRDIVDIVLTFSQAQYDPTKILLKARINDLIVSQESEDLLNGFQFPALKPYEDLKAIISSMLEKHHSKNLATYFELSPAEIDRIGNDSSPGRMLIKILDEREKIMPQKMIYLFQGLKDCRLDKIARMVSEYIEKNTEQTRQEKQQLEKKTKESLQAISASTKQQIRVRSRKRDRSVPTTLSSSSVSSDVHVRKLNEVVEALDIAKDKLLSTRKALQCIEGQPGKH